MVYIQRKHDPWCCTGTYNIANPWIPFVTHLLCKTWKFTPTFCLLSFTESLTQENTFSHSSTTSAKFPKNLCSWNLAKPCLKSKYMNKITFPDLLKKTQKQKNQEVCKAGIFFTGPCWFTVIHIPSRCPQILSFFQFLLN